MFRRAMLAVVVVLVALDSMGRAAADDLQLWYDPDFTAYLWNTTSADISFDGYQIVSETNTLDVAGWDSIADRFPDRLTELMDNLGAGAVAFGELNPNSSQVAEGNLTGVGVLKAGAKFSLGKPFGNAFPGAGDDFFYKIGGVTSQVISIIVPEPSTLVLATLAGLGLVAMRVRSKR